MRYVDQRSAIRRGELVNRPDESWTKDELREYLDRIGVEHLSHDTKDELLARVP